jgi:hypothetical protein
MLNLNHGGAWRPWRTLGLTVASFLLFAGTATAQVQTGILTGTARDTAGLVLPGVTVTVQSPALMGERTGVTDMNGVYVLRGLPPGSYVVRFELAGMAPVEETTRVELGGTTSVDATLAIAALAEEVTVTATPAPIATPTGGQNYRWEDLAGLPQPRTLSGIASLAPGLTTNTPNVGQLAISGSFAYDNVFLVDGVDVNDNLFGTPNNLFIEDAIEETQVLTSGISAEYGRFSGGIVNAITRSGGNDFSGSYRLNFTDPAWTRQTPFERERDITRESDLSQVHEMTFGGPIMIDRVWFFGAGRFQDTAATDTFPETGIPVTRETTNIRGEIKGTATLWPNHTLQGTYLNNSTSQTQPTFTFSIDPNTIVDRTLPNTLGVVNWNGVLSPTLFGNFQVSRKVFGFRDSGGTSTDIVDSPYLSRAGLGVPGSLHYNAPYFDSTDPEDRNNWQFAGSLAHFRSTETLGTHDVKAGFEFFNSTRIGGNSQTATGFVFHTAYANDAGQPIFAPDGRLIPMFVPGHTLTQNWLPVRGARIDIGTLSFYLHDRWMASRHFTFDLGVRYERVRGEATGDIVTVDTDTVVPRLGATYDVLGDGRFVVQSSYAHYAGKYSEAQFARTTNVGIPNSLTYIYTGPEGQGRTFGPGLDIGNYQLVSGSFPLQTVFFDDNLRSPTTREFTLSVGGALGADGYGRVIYTRRDMTDFVESFITMDTGQTTVTHEGLTFGTFNNTVYRNTDIPDREYQSLQFQTRYRLRGQMFLNGHYTMQLRNHGNFEGEATNQPAIPSTIGTYPEILDMERNNPFGRLNQFQRHRVRLWSTVPLDLRRIGGFDLGLMYRYDSPLTFSLAAAGVPLTPEQIARDPGYANLPVTQSLFFAERGTEFFPDHAHLFDMSINYNIPIWRTLRPWLKFDVLNVFGSEAIRQHNTTILPDPASPRDALGLPTGFIPGAQFGQPTSAGHFVTPRTYQVAFGLRF